MNKKWLFACITLALSISTLCPTTTFAAQQVGDLNNDGFVDAIDFAVYRKYLLGAHDLENKLIADFNQDGKADSIDFALMRRYMLGFDSQLGTGYNNNENNNDELEYVEKIFGQEIISIEIIANNLEWENMLKNATSEEYIKVDVVVNGTKFTDVGIRPKGNSSLSQVASMNSNRYSFRLKFDKYVENQTCFGLETFVLNNMMSDNTYMKEYVTFDMMKTVGVKAPLYGFSDIFVNGESWGTYFTVELYNKNYEERVFGDKKAKLYNVKMTSGDLNGGGGGFGMGNFGTDNGGSLKFKDSNSSSYPDIFQNGVGTTEEADYQRVITALKALSTNTELEKYVDVDATLRYLAAHTFVVNLDSYSSNMAQNYYLCERNGQISMLPWDYNFAWGGFMSGDAKSVVNFPIDTPVSGVNMSDRPMIDKLLSNQTYLNTYHEYLKLLVDEYFANGKFDAKIKQLDSLISSHVQNDPSKFCTYDQYKKAVTAFIQLGNLRAQSIDGQLNGTIPSTSSGQSAN